MRPDELGAMKETRCVIKLRNQQPIFGVRNFYYADGELMRRAWLQVKAQKAQSVVGAATPFPDLDLESNASADRPISASAEAGAKFAARCTYAATSSTTRNPEGHLETSPAPHQSDLRGEPAIKDAATGGPDFKSAMKKSAERRADAENAIEKILPLLENAPAKKRAAKKVQKEIASAFSDS